MKKTPEIHIPQLKKVLSALPEKSLLSLLKENQIPIGSSCGGEGICTKCYVKIEKGANHLTPPSDLEKKMSSQHRMGEDLRMSCQAFVRGDIEISTTYW